VVVTFVPYFILNELKTSVLFLLKQISRCLIQPPGPLGPSPHPCWGVLHLDPSHRCTEGAGGGGGRKEGGQLMYPLKRLEKTFENSKNKKIWDHPGFSHNPMYPLKRFENGCVSLIRVWNKITYKTFHVVLCLMSNLDMEA
jgi:hypothetical protein